MEQQITEKEVEKLPPTIRAHPSESFESAELAALFSALAKSQLEMEVASHNSTNPFFKSSYSDLSGMVKASRPYLAKNGLSIIQRILPDSKGVLNLFTRLCHLSGQWMESRMPVAPPKQDIQTIGSYITYIRRYSYASIVCVVSNDEDDDGEKAMEVSRKTGKTDKGSETISKVQLQVLSDELEDYEEILEGILSGFKIGKLSDLSSKHYTQCINRIKEIKRAKEAC